MAEGYKDWTAGATLTAADLEDYTVRQSVMRFASAAARDTALAAVLTEGMLAYLLDTNTLTVRTGAGWSTVGPVHGALTSWTPVITQGATPTFTNVRSVYTRLGRWCWGSLHCTITGTPGTASNNIITTLPFTAAGGLLFGTGKVIDSSASLEYPAFMAFNTATNFLLQLTTPAIGASYLGTSGFTAALASGDTVTANFAFEVAADA